MPGGGGGKVKLIGIDFETTGLDFDKDRITEIGAVLWDSEMGIPLQIYSALVLDTSGPGLSEEITAHTGITDEMLAENGEDPGAAFTKLFAMMEAAEFAVAHFGATFDKPMIEASDGRTGGITSIRLPEMTWIDTALDVPFPDKIKTRNLRHLAAEHGFVNPFAHRAVFDVLTMLTILDRYPLDMVIESARQPLVRLKALVSFDDRYKAKARGYKWNGDAKEWTLTLKVGKAEIERAECGFKTIIIN